MMRRRITPVMGLSVTSSLYYHNLRAQSINDPLSNRDKQRFQDGAEPSSGGQLSIMEVPSVARDLFEFPYKPSTHIKANEKSEEERRLSDTERNRRMVEKFGPLGPGQRLVKSPQQEKRDMLQKQQDLDGLPWEVRWRKSLIPTAEELVQDFRDKFELHYQDPIEREVQWYLHWKDRLFKIQKDRLIWPQGYTDYFEHYDGEGRRRALPGDQRWTDQNWKHLTDNKHKERMWLAHSEEHKLMNMIESTSPSGMIHDADQRHMENIETSHAMMIGVIDMDPQQTQKVLAGSADPLEVAKTQRKLDMHHAEMFLDVSRNKVKVDPETGHPVTSVSDEMLPSGVTVGQAAVIEMKVTGMTDKIDDAAALARDMQGKTAELEVSKMYLKESRRRDDQPMARTEAERLVAKVSDLNRKAGYLDVPKMPEIEDGNDKPTTTSSGRETDLYYTPQEKALQDLPEWYEKTLVNPGKPILQYNMTNDPIEQAPVDENLKPFVYKKPSSKDEIHRITEDDMTAGENAFDEMKVLRQKTVPELVTEFKPLPTYDDAIKMLTDQEEKEKNAVKTPAQKLAQKRKERLKPKKDFVWSEDMVLPDLPWDTDPVSDPYRGVSDSNAVSFNKKELAIVFQTYKNFVVKLVVEFRNMMTGDTAVAESRLETLINDAISQVQKGNVGEHPPCAEEHLEVFRLCFEGHVRHFLADWYSYRGGRKPEQDAMKHKAQQLMHQAAAKAKLLGQPFVEFVQEQTSLELDAVKKSPHVRNRATVADKKHEIFAKPFERWLQAMSDMLKTDYSTYEALEVQREYIFRNLGEARNQSPSNVEGVNEQLRTALIETFYFYFRGALSYHAARKVFEFFLTYGESRFKSKAEELYEESYECFENYLKVAKQCGAFLPVPYCEPLIDFGDSEYLEGENAFAAELRGDFERAEKLWHSGTRFRWYPIVDETDYVEFLERRGRISMAQDASDRCLENMNKKTHPSVHPFPEAAHVWLEGAPLTQETAEHLWLRHMSDVYMTHSGFLQRTGKYGTSQEYLQHAVGLLRVAVKQSQERLPPTWTAPILTYAKYIIALSKVAESDEDIEFVLQEGEKTIEKMRQLPELPIHWVERTTEYHYRLELFSHMQLGYISRIMKGASKQIGREITRDDLLANLKHREKTGTDLPVMEAYENAIDTHAEPFRQYVLSQRDKEKPNTDHWHMFNFYYFAVRVRPKSPEEVKQLRDMFWPTYDYLYTHAALGHRARQIHFPMALRRYCLIMCRGDEEQRKELLKELRRLNEVMKHVLDGEDLKRTILSLENNLRTNGKIPIYIFGTATQSKDAHKAVSAFNNPVMRNAMGAADYSKLRQKERAAKLQGDSQYQPSRSEASLRAAQETDYNDGGSTGDASAKGSMKDRLEK
eukprot:PhF_6_TR25594/c0_g1_i1/m.35903